MASYDADDGEEKAEWTSRNEGIFIRILHEHVKKGDLQTSTFSKKTWSMICDELFAESNRRYTVPQLKSKFNRLRKKHREFAGLINHTGFKWDPNSNTVTASTDAWEEYTKRVPAVRAYRKKGLEYYYILGEIFNATTVTGQMYHTSSQVPPNSDEDREVEENYFNSGVHVNLCEDVGETDPQVENSKGKRVRRFFDQSPADRRLKNILDRMENYLDMCTEVMRHKVEKRRAKAQESDQFSTEECLQIVEAMGVDNDTYIKFVDKMVDIEWRKAFLCMSDDRRRVWLAHLN